MDGESLLYTPLRTLVRRRFIIALAGVTLIYFAQMEYEFAATIVDKMKISGIEGPDPIHDTQRPIVREHIEQSSDPRKSPPQEPFLVFIHKAANLYEVEAALIKAIIMAESGYNPRAISKKGAKGLMQLMPKTAEALGVKDSFDPEHNITAGVKYFRQLQDRFNGNMELALAAYNAGSRNVRQYNGIPPFESTRKYVKKVLMYYHKYKENEVTMS